MDLVSRAQDLSNKADRNINLYLAGTEIDDALEVLNGGNLHFADAVPMFEDAKALIGKGKMREALKVLDKVRDVMIDRSGV